MTDLVPEWRIGDLVLTDYPYAVEFDSVDYGTPDVTVDVLRSFLSSGDIEVTSREGNRTLTLSVLVEGSDMLDLATNEAALDLERRKFNELYCDPGDGFGPPFVYQVFPGQMAFSRGESTEMANVRRWVLTFRGLPHAKSATETVTPALAASGATTTSVDTMGATTNWTAAVDGVAVTPTVASGALTAQSTTALSGSHTVTLTRTAAITTSATPYLVVDWKAGAGNEVTDFSASADGVALVRLASGPSPTAGYTRSTFDADVASVAAVTFSLTTTSGRTADSSALIRDPVIRSLTLDNLDRTDVRPSIGTARQLLRSIDVGGSAPTTGSLAVSHATSALGDLLIYTCPTDTLGYVPACRNYRVSGSGLMADATTVSGYYDVITTGATTYDVPVAALPDGEYLMVARVRANTAGSAGSTTLTVTHVPRMNSVSLATPTTVSVTPETSGVTAVTAEYSFVRLGMVHLPLWDAAPGASSVNRFTIAATNTLSLDVRLDEFYLFNLSTGRLTQVACGTSAPSAGGSSNRLWIDSPALANGGLGRYLRGYAADRSDAYSAHPSMTAQGVHEFVPPSVKVFTVATNPSTEVDVALSAAAAWHTHAAA